MFEGYKDFMQFLDQLPAPDAPDVVAACAYSDIIDEISMALVDYRLNHDLSQMDLAEKLSISQSMVSQYESGARNISLNKLCSLMAILGKKVSILLEDISVDAELSEPSVPNSQMSDNDIIDFAISA